MTDTGNLPSVESLTEAALHLHAAKLFQVASFVILIYDYCLTFSEEVERIWKERITGITILFLFNRYATPLQAIIIIDAFHDPRWSLAVCRRFVGFKAATSVTLIAVAELLMILRVYALYDRNMFILAFLLVLWVFQVTISSAALRDGFALSLPADLTGCIFSGLSPIMAAVWVTPLVTNAIMFLLTLFRSWRWMKQSQRPARLIHVLVRDGTTYFLITFAVNLLNTLIFFLAVKDLKSIGATFSQFITSIMISRLVLNLRANSVTINRTTLDGAIELNTFGDRVMGPMGNVLDTFLDTIPDPEFDSDEDEIWEHSPLRYP